MVSVDEYCNGDNRVLTSLSEQEDTQFSEKPGDLASEWKYFSQSENQVIPQYTQTGHGIFWQDKVR